MTPRAPSARPCVAGDAIAGAKVAEAGCRRSRSVQGRSTVSSIKTSIAGAVPVPPSSCVPVPPSCRPVPPSGRGGRGPRRPPPKAHLGNAVCIEGAQVAEVVATPRPNLRQMLASSQPTVAMASPDMQKPTSMQKDQGVSGDREDHANHQCSISLDAPQSAEIRTKVFRMGAPLLRSTIPVTLGTPRLSEVEMLSAARCTKKQNQGDGDADSDAETILSLSEVGIDDIGTLSVTFDFPC